MKNKKLLLLIPFLSIVVGCDNKPGEAPEEKPEEEPTLKEKYNLKTENSFLPDSNFAHGINLWSSNLETAKIEGTIDYGGDRLTDSGAYYNMPQWGAAKSLFYSDFSKENDTYIYTNEYRELKVNPKEGSITIGLDTYKEYQDLYQGEKPTGAFWSHYLLESQFPNELQTRLSTLENLYVKFDITFNELVCKGAEPAQFLFYFCFWDATLSRNAMWFGVPIYDSRYNYITEYKQLDNQNSSNTGLPIYSISSKDYMGSSKVVTGKTYHIDIDVIDYIKQGFIYWATQGAFPEGTDFTNLMLYYMNIGWEIPGQYKVSSTISNFDIYTIRD